MKLEEKQLHLPDAIKNKIGEKNLSAATNLHLKSPKCYKYKYIQYIQTCIDTHLQHGQQIMYNCLNIINLSAHFSVALGRYWE